MPPRGGNITTYGVWSNRTEAACCHVKINDIAIAALDEDALRKQLRTSPLKLTLQSGETTRDVTVTFP